MPFVFALSKIGSGRDFRKQKAASSEAAELCLALKIAYLLKIDIIS